MLYVELKLCLDKPFLDRQMFILTVIYKPINKL